MLIINFVRTHPYKRKEKEGYSSILNIFVANIKNQTI